MGVIFFTAMRSHQVLMIMTAAGTFQIVFLTFGRGSRCVFWRKRKTGQEGEPVYLSR